MMPAGDHRDTGPLRDGAAPAATQRQDRHRQPGRQGGGQTLISEPHLLKPGPWAWPQAGRRALGLWALSVAAHWGPCLHREMKATRKFKPQWQVVAY
jgi:hypothetical protein